jgi:hypothetical protein
MIEAITQLFLSSPLYLNVIATHGTVGGVSRRTIVSEQEQEAE